MHRRDSDSEDVKPLKKRKTGSEPRTAAESTSDSQVPRSSSGQHNENIEIAGGNTSQPPAPENTRHPKLWFPDGLVTVVASDGTEFRLHAGILSYHSEVLRERLAALSSPHAAQSNSQSLPSIPQEVVLHLPEKGHELGEFFTMFYDGVTQ
ncbi:hypothetical protein BDY19DRAFT_932780 [Irpex rosettiformis]|uniref:Uncharacterized protein n=1 Tax=Irpex rosettiformis TaxID=378272 RepID=A0ACB8U9P7_9APHY|nr:hypothetical protein BDY19DRAFT_932780 [Irpex rosettiformis]